MSAGLDLDALDQVAQASTVVRKGTVKISAHLAGASPALTLAETGVLRLAAQGLSDVAISRQLRCSLQSVLDALKSVYAKLQLPIDGLTDERTAAVLWWVTR